MKNPILKIIKNFAHDIIKQQSKGWCWITYMIYNEIENHVFYEKPWEGYIIGLISINLILISIEWFNGFIIDTSYSIFVIEKQCS